MSISKRNVLALLISVLLISLPLVVAYSAGGTIEGKVMDPKGAGIAGATVTITDSATNQSITVQSDAQGQFKAEGLAGGIYSLTVSAKGFSGAVKNSVKVVDGTTVQADIKLSIAEVEASVTVPASVKANSDAVYQSLRNQAKSIQDFSSYATVNGFTIKRSGASLLFRSGELYFLNPTEARTTAAVFIGEGEMTLVPPTEIEKNSLKIFTGQPQLAEPFTSAVLRFTDKTFDEIKSSITISTGGTRAGTARDLFRENQNLVRKELRDNRELRVLQDLYNPDQPGFFIAYINGRKFNKLVFVDDPFCLSQVAPEEVALFSYGESDGGLWTAYHRPEEYENGTAANDEDNRIIDITNHDIDAVIKGTTLSATDKLTFKVLVQGTRVIPLNLFGSLRVNRVLDEEGKELDFIQEAKDEDSDLAVILPKRLDKDKSYKLTVSYSGGDALRDSGGGNFILLPRSSWYPNNGNTQFGDRATFEFTFHYPNSLTFVGTGSPVGTESRDGDLAVAKWSSGTTELAVAGFNFGRFKKKEVDDNITAYKIQFYANEELPNEVSQVKTFGSLSTTGMANSILTDAQNSTRIYDAYFGKLPYTRIAMTQQPAGFFGQAWPTLIYMPYFAFMDSTQRYMLFGARGASDNFWKYVAPHEIAHQWWGHVIGWSSYHDQWMSEGFAEFSSSVYVEQVRGTEKFLEFWEDQRKLIIEARPATKERKPYTIGPVTQGYRLNSGRTGGVARFLIYPKGAYILHMIRMMMKDADGDKNFQAMMKDFVQTHFNQDVSTEDFKRIVEKHITPNLNLDRNGKMDWFFNAWVYGTEMPSYKLAYKINPDGSLSGQLTQSGVSEDFKMIVPLYVDLGKGWVKLGAAPIKGNMSIPLNNIKASAPIKKAAICAMNDVLAASIENSK